jgi:hypothetical protein
LALAYQFASRIDLVDLSSGHQTIATGPEAVKASYRIDEKTGRFFWKEDNQHAYLAITADETFIYALFCGQHDNQRGSNDLVANRIHVFDWSGRFIESLAVDRPIFTLGISDSSDILYAWVQDPWSAVASFPLSPSLRARLRAKQSALN